MCVYVFCKLLTTYTHLIPLIAQVCKVLCAVAASNARDAMFDPTILNDSTAGFPFRCNRDLELHTS